MLCDNCKKSGRGQIKLGFAARRGSIYTLFARAWQAVFPARFRPPRGTEMTARRQPKASVKLYTRPGCHLCDDAKREMSAAGCGDLYDLEEINIDTDPE